MRVWFVAYVVLLTMTETAKSGSNSEEDESEEFSQKSITRFDLKGNLQRSFALEAALPDPEKNLICSPLSALLPLGKLAFGAKKTTLKELLLAIGISRKSRLRKKLRRLIKDLQHLPGVTLDIASRVYLDTKHRLNDKYVQDTKSVFKSGVRKIDFANPDKAVDLINEWVSVQTKGMIPNVLLPGDISSSSSLIMVNAIYFAGKWMNPFYSIKSSNFLTPWGPRKVVMMTRNGEYKYLNSDVFKSQIIEIPYVGNKASLIVVLPNSRDGLQVLLRQLKLTPDSLNDELRKMSNERIELTIPKFKAHSELDLHALYEKIGLKNIFNTQQSQLTGIVRDEELHVSKAVQKVIIEVNEIGTEAAASSALNIVGLSFIRPRIINIAHPFMFFVNVNSQQLLTGICTSPNN